jgi:hypothetical protein
MTGFTGANPWATQPGISPGRWDDVDPALRAAVYVPLDNTR